MSQESKPPAEHCVNNSNPGFEAAEESVFDKIPVTVKQLDIFIICLIIGIVVALVLGVLTGR